MISYLITIFTLFYNFLVRTAYERWSERFFSVKTFGPHTFGPDFYFDIRNMRNRFCARIANSRAQHLRSADGRVVSVGERNQSLAAKIQERSQKIRRCVTPLPRHPYLTAHSCACDTGPQVAFVNQEARKSVPRDKWQVHVPRALRKSADWQTRWASILKKHREDGWTKGGEFKAHSQYKSLEEAEQMVVELVPHPHTNPSPH